VLLVLRRVHVVAEFVRGEPQLGLEAQSGPAGVESAVALLPAPPLAADLRALSLSFAMGQPHGLVIAHVHWTGMLSPSPAILVISVSDGTLGDATSRRCHLQCIRDRAKPHLGRRLDHNAAADFEPGLFLASTGAEPSFPSPLT
jgi:hypothetical protein